MKRFLIFAAALLALTGPPATAQVVNMAAQPRTANGQMKLPTPVIVVDKDYIGTVTTRPYNYNGQSVDPAFQVMLDSSGNQVTAATTDTAQTFSNKTLDNTNIITVKDLNLTIQDDGGTTKQFRFQASGITAGQTRTLTVPNFDATLATLAGTETFTNKTLTSPTIATPTITGAVGPTGIWSFNNVTVNQTAAGGNYRLYNWQSSGTTRFAMGVDNTADGGASTGSDWHLFRYNDAGTPADVLFVSRASGAVTASGAWAFGSTVSTGALTATTGTFSGAITSTTITTSSGGSIMNGTASNAEATPLTVRNNIAYGGTSQIASLTFVPSTTNGGSRIQGYATASNSSGFKFITENGGSGNLALTLAPSLAATFASSVSATGLTATSAGIDVTGTTRLRGENLSSLGASDPVAGNSSGWALQNSGYLSMANANTILIGLNRTGSDGGVMAFYRQTTAVGSINVTASATSYATSSDYRLKTNVTRADPATSLALINKVLIRNFDWKVDGSHDRGVLAHELALVKPTAVSGKKDAKDEKGKPIYQGVDYSKLVPDLVAAVQALSAANDNLRARVAVLEARAN